MEFTEKKELEGIVTPICRAHGLELVDIFCGREQDGPVMRVLIDREQPLVEAHEYRSGVSLKDCQEVSRDLSTVLDVHDVAKKAYRLEVSSPGLDRPLVKLNDFVRFQGQQAKIATHEPIQERRKFQGKLLGVNGESVTIEQDGTPVCIPYRDIKKANLIYRFNNTTTKTSS